MTTLQEEIIAEVRNCVNGLNGVPEVRMVAISLGYTFVELDNGIMGVCFTPRSASGSCAHYPAAGTLSEKPVLQLAELMGSGHPLERSVGVAAVNALSHTIMAQHPDQFRFSKDDFLDLLPFEAPGSNKVGMVGYIGPFVPFLKKKADALVVVDDNPALETGVVAATKITDLAGARRTILEGGGTPQFIDYGRKYTLIPR